MIAGHFGFAAIVKSREKAIPLWSLMLASVWLDIVFLPLFVAGIETIVPLPGTKGGYGEGVIHADYTHSVPGALLLSALYGLFFGWRWSRRAGWVLAATVFSHWVLDLPMHHHDMPLWPGQMDGPRFGFGLWRFPIASMVLELVILAVGVSLYQRAAREVAAPVGEAEKRKANVAALSVAAVGLLTLALNVAGM
jgi:hypothetical protein